MFKQDWIERQICDTIKMLSTLVLKTESISYEVENIDSTTSEDDLYLALDKLINEKKLNEAEDLLFESFDYKNAKHLKICLWFYETLNAWSEKELADANFSRDELESGLKELTEPYGVQFT